MMIRSFRLAGRIFALLLIASPATGYAQGCRPAQAVADVDALRLVTSVRAYDNGSFFSQGSGVVIGEDDQTLYVATAAHVVTDIGAPVDSALIAFYDDCDRRVPARVCSPPPAPGDLDIALLCVEKQPGRRFATLSFSRHGDVNRLGPLSPVYPVGCPVRECWGVGEPDRSQRVEREPPRILFSTFSVSQGHSGGALFNEWWEVVGLITLTGEPFSVAIPIDAVLANLCRSAEDGSETCQPFPIDLEEPFVPRGGYRWSVGVSGLAPTEDLGLGFPGGRFPAGRASLMYQIGDLVEVHGTALRLTPSDISVTGGMVGVGLFVRKGRFALNPYVEGGFAHVDGRFDAGGFFVDDTSLDSYQPFYNQVTEDVLGFGTAFAVQALVLPRTILEAYVGHWNFNLPEPLGDPDATPEEALLSISDWPDLFIGLGLRFGL